MCAQSKKSRNNNSRRKQDEKKTEALQKHTAAEEVQLPLRMAAEKGRGTQREGRRELLQV